MAKLYIDQKKNFRSDFGEVLRSSSIFWVKNSIDFSSSISFMNYWKLKRDLKVSIFATTRRMDGLLIKRERLTFDQGEVINYRNFPVGDFEGSVEIEVFSLENMVIPYSAMMVVYESAKGVSMVHSYTRTYSRHEVEDGDVISDGEEGCWLLKDSKTIQSFAVVHNGAKALLDQSWALEVTNHKGEVQQAKIQVAVLKSYETLKIVPEKYISNLSEFLDDRTGSATLSFVLGESFTRMLVGHQTRDGQDLQVTHSNFNYSRHQTDMLEGVSSGIMYLPKLPDFDLRAIVYPDAEKGEYGVLKENGNLKFCSGKLLKWSVGFEKTATFAKVDGGGFPSRIVTGIEGGLSKSNAMPFECSLGVASSKRPPKRMWWGLFAAMKNLNSRIVAIPMTEIYGDIAPETKISISLYGAKTHTKLEKTVSYNELKDMRQGIYFRDLFPEVNTITQGDIGYFTFFSEYPGFGVYSTIENEFGSLTIEHGF
jgi:hypothetical protein